MLFPVAHHLDCWESFFVDSIVSFLSLVLLRKDTPDTYPINFFAHLLMILKYCYPKLGKSHITVMYTPVSFIFDHLGNIERDQVISHFCVISTIVIFNHQYRYSPDFRRSLVIFQHLSHQKCQRSLLYGKYEGISSVVSERFDDCMSEVCFNRRHGKRDDLQY